MNEDTFFPKLSDTLLCNYYGKCNHKALGTRILKRKTSLKVKNCINEEKREEERREGSREGGGQRWYENVLSIKTRQK